MESQRSEISDETEASCRCLRRPAFDVIHAENINSTFLLRLRFSSRPLTDSAREHPAGSGRRVGVNLNPAHGA